MLRTIMIAEMLELHACCVQPEKMKALHLPSRVKVGGD
jgi:hypothetical protein